MNAGPLYAVGQAGEQVLRSPAGDDAAGHMLYPASAQSRDGPKFPEGVLIPENPVPL